MQRCSRCSATAVFALIVALTGCAKTERFSTASTVTGQPPAPVEDASAEADQRIQVIELELQEAWETAAEVRYLRALKELSKKDLRSEFERLDRLAASGGASAEERLRLAGVYTHLACADEADLEPSREQLRAFGRVLDDVRGRGVDPGDVHWANEVRSSASARSIAWTTRTSRCGTRSS